MSPRYINPVQWQQSIGYARQACARLFRDGGTPADGAIKSEASAVHTFREGGGSNWSIYPPQTSRDEKVPLAWKSFATSFTPSPITFGYRWNDQLTRRSGSLVALPQR